jgi:hypothetical protein
LRRPEFARRFPLQVDWRVNAVNLRSRPSLRRLLRSFWMGTKSNFRVVHCAVTRNQIHLIVEADGKVALSSGMKGVGVRAAKALNKMMGRRGRVLADRYCARILRSPAEVKRARLSLLTNTARPRGLVRPDRFAATEVLAAPETWLLRQRW